ncbi:hypothetical protein NOVOSPHI9U_370053 [Novosphingobium sp. 9U]|nr:hypothetical protein NOVOSPHI9U_370053 [Novosphingobium sp. 9U]
MAGPLLVAGLLGREVRRRDPVEHHRLVTAAVVGDRADRTLVALQARKQPVGARGDPVGLLERPGGGESAGELPAIVPPATFLVASEGAIDLVDGNNVGHGRAPWLSDDRQGEPFGLIVGDRQVELGRLGGREDRGVGKSAEACLVVPEVETMLGVALGDDERPQILVLRSGGQDLVPALAERPFDCDRDRQYLGMVRRAGHAGTMVEALKLDPQSGVIAFDDGLGGDRRCKQCADLVGVAQQLVEAIGAAVSEGRMVGIAHVDHADYGLQDLYDFGGEARGLRKGHR